MYFRFVLDPSVPHGIQKIIRRVIRDLRSILQDVTYSIEQDETLLPLVKNHFVPVSKIFQRKLPMACRGVAIYILNAAIIWNRYEIYGLSHRSKCTIGIKGIPSVNNAVWTAKVWELILHEVGHSLGLIEETRTRQKFIKGFANTKHCVFDCVMSEDILETVWARRSQSRFKRYSPYCESCKKYLILHDV